MSAISETGPAKAARAPAFRPASALRRIAAGSVRLLAFAFYALGRGVLMLVRAPRSQTGLPEAIVGFMIVLGLVAALLKLPFRLILASLLR